MSKSPLDPLRRIGPARKAPITREELMAMWMKRAHLCRALIETMGLEEWPLGQDIAGVGVDWSRGVGSRLAGPECDALTAIALDTYSLAIRPSGMCAPPSCQVTRLVLPGMHATPSADPSQSLPDGNVSNPDWLSGLGDQAPIGIAAWDADRKVISWSAQADRTTGWSAIEVMGCRIESFPSIDLEDVPVIDIAIESLLNGTQRQAMFRTRIDKCGRTVHCEWHNSAVLSEIGQVRAILSFIIDVTKQVSGQAEIDTRIQQLQRTVASLEQTNVELSKSLEGAEQELIARSAFMAHLSHEIKTPLNGVVGMTSLLTDTPLTPAQMELARTAYGSAMSLVRLLDDSLDRSNIEAGRLSIAAEPFDLHLLAAEIAESMANRAQARRTQLITVCGQNEPMRVLGDRDRIRQVLANLLDNSICATESGEVRLHIDCTEVPHEALNVRFTIDDTGDAFPHDRMDCIFEEGAVSGQSMARSGGRPVSGLSLSRKLVEMMGGSIGASNTQSGVRFWVQIPLTVAGDSDVISPPAVDIRDLRVCVVSDMESDRRRLTGYLGRRGIRTGEFVSPHEAIAAMSAAARHGDPYQVAVWDSDMQLMTGHELLRKLESDLTLRGTAIVLVGSAGQTAGIEVHTGARLLWRLGKPVREWQLANALVMARRALETTPAADRWHAQAIRETAPMVPAAPRRESTGSALKPNAAARSVRALVAEDNLVNQQVSSQMLENLGCEVDIAANGREAIRLLERRSYDIVFMDCLMPEVDGIQATIQIRKSAGAARIVPIVGVSASTREQDRQKCLAAGMDGFIGKPVQQSELERCLDEFVHPKPGFPSSVSQQSSRSEAFDRARLLDRLGGDLDFLRYVVCLFDSVGPRLTAEIRRACESRNQEHVVRAAHELKGTLMNLCAAPAAAAVSKFERLEDFADESFCAELCAEMETEITQLRSALLTLLEFSGKERQ